MLWTRKAMTGNRTDHPTGQSIPIRLNKIIHECKTTRYIL
jgi:hypothetical protein